MLPLLTLQDDDTTVSVDELGEEEPTEWQLPAVFQPSRPTVPTVPSVPGRADPQARLDENAQYATMLLERGKVSLAVFGASTRVLQLVLDVANVPPVRTLGLFKSLVADSWIVGSNALAVPARRADIEVAVLRAMIMLVSKRALGLKQLGAAREVLGALNFVGVAAAALRAVGNDATSDLQETLSQIASLPFLVYTSLARLVVDTSSVVKAWAETIDWSEVRNEVAARGKLDRDVKGRIGKGGRTLVAEWRAFLRSNADLAAYVKKHAMGVFALREKTLLEFNRVLA